MNSANFTTNFSNATTGLVLASTYVNGPGTITNALGKTLNMSYGAMNAPFANYGTLVFTGSGTIAGSTFFADTASTLRVQGSNAGGHTSLTVTGGLAARGNLELTSIEQGFNATLTVTGGSLTNTFGDTIYTRAGTGGSRTIVGAVAVDGALNLTPGAAGVLGITGSLAGDGSFIMDLGGTTAGTQYDQILITGTPGTLTLGNTYLYVNTFGGFTPLSGNSFTLMTYTSAVGGFEIFNPPWGAGTYNLNPTALVITRP